MMIMAANRYGTYRVQRGTGMGGFMSPPGHANHTWTLVEIRGGHEVGHMTLDSIDDPSVNASPAIRAEVNRIRQGLLTPSELWIRQVYGYFRNAYVPASGSRNASDLIFFNPGQDAAASVNRVLIDAGYKRGGSSILGDVDGFRTAVRDDGSLIHVRQVCGGMNIPEGPMLPLYAAALTSAGYRDVTVGPEHVHAAPPVVPTRPDPETHAAVACIRQYFPDHVARVELILNPGKGYGSWPCDTCGERVQYEARHDALCVVSTRLAGSGITEWSYGQAHADGTPHTVTD